jgi:hypothetical protein
VTDNKRLRCCTSSSTSLSSQLKGLPDETVIDGELVALGPDGKPSFNLLQNLRSAESPIIYYAFDILFRKGEDLTQLPLSKRREVLESVVKPSDHVGLSQVADKTSPQMLRFVRAHGLDLRTALRFRHSFRYESEMASFCAPLRRRSSLPQTYVSRRGTHADNGVGNSAPIVYRRVPNALRPG